MKFIRLLLTLFVPLSFLAACGSAGSFSAASDSNLILESAKEEIALSKATNNSETACSIYVRNVLIRAGYAVPNFMANDFDKIAEKYMPGWAMNSFTADSSEHGREALKALLNSYPDHTAFLAQWPRASGSGHVAILEKNSHDEFTIYQAQQGKATPHQKSTTADSLLYSRNQWGDRTHLRIFTQP